MNLTQMPKAQLAARKQQLQQQYAAYQAQGLQLNMARGKPGPEQLDLSLPMLDAVSSKSDLHAGGVDCRNYGGPDGLPEMRALMGQLMGLPAENVLAGGNSSLNLMFDTVACLLLKGAPGCKPWAQQGKCKFLCPAPGYDRHFAVTEYFGFELVTVPMLPTGPDMDLVEQLVQDPSVKGIWNVPKYSNPTGYTYADSTVRRFAALKPAAPDFRIFWDNAYCVHDLRDTPDTLLNLWEACCRCGNEDLPLFFASTSKITFPGAGIAALGASKANLEQLRGFHGFQSIGPDKINQLRHLRYLKDAGGVRALMQQHRAILEPKFQVVLDTFARELGGKGIAQWTTPNGGYFISVDVLPGCAKRTVALCKAAGVTLTGAGATFPYGRDPQDSNIRIAPSFPSVAELGTASELFCLCAELAACEKLG